MYICYSKERAENPDCLIIKFTWLMYLYSKENKMNDKIKKWFVSEFPNDPIGEEINPNVSFSELYEAIKSNRNVLGLLGVENNKLLERIFEKIARIKNVPFGIIMNKYTWSDI